MKGRGLAAAIGFVAALAGAPAARADVIFLVNGNTIQVEAWRDRGDAIEIARGGGIIQIPKTEISRIEGTNQTVQPVTAVLLPVKVRSRRPPRVPYSDTRLAGRATFPRESSGRKSSAAGERCLSRSDRSRRASNRAGRSKANTGGSVEMPPDRSRGRDCGGADSLV